MSIVSILSLTNFPDYDQSFFKKNIAIGYFYVHFILNESLKKESFKENAVAESIYYMKNARNQWM